MSSNLASPKCPHLIEISQLPSVVPLVNRCSIQPRTNHAAWEIHNRPFHLENSWSNFDPCSSDANQCRIATSRISLFDETVARLDEQGRYWLMNRKDDGWGEFGIPFRSLAEIVKKYEVVVGTRDKDSASVFWHIHPLLSKNAVCRECSTACAN